jgi:glutamine amidotransferase
VGHAPQRRPRHVPELGLPDPPADLQRLPLRARRLIDVCRHLAYVGPPVPLGALLVDPPHALVHQARAARLQPSGTTNPDGYGIAWYATPGAAPCRHRTARPMWTDPRLADLATRVRAPAVLAAVRLASPGLPVDPSGNAPFVADRLAFSHNGVVDRWHDDAGPRLRALVSPPRAAGIEGESDAETLFALALDRVDAGAPLGAALAELVGLVEEHTTGRFNFLLTDGEQAAATACGNSLFVHADDGATIVASEPLDDASGWEPVADRSVVTVEAAGVRREPL